jgi:hypothetical protein
MAIPANCLQTEPLRNRTQYMLRQVQKGAAFCQCFTPLLDVLGSSLPAVQDRLLTSHIAQHAAAKSICAQHPVAYW